MAPALEAKKKEFPVDQKITKSETEWKKELPPEAFHVLREKGTEAAFTGAYWNNHEQGMYRCKACGLALFSSKEKLCVALAMADLRSFKRTGAATLFKTDSVLTALCAL
jgi:peptide-methionine (R)-S-oxide reductase